MVNYQWLSIWQSAQNNWFYLGNISSVYTADSRTERDLYEIWRFTRDLVAYADSLLSTDGPMLDGKGVGETARAKLIVLGYLLFIFGLNSINIKQHQSYWAWSLYCLQLWFGVCGPVQVDLIEIGLQSHSSNFNSFKLCSHSYLVKIAK